MSGYTPVFDSVFQGTLCGKYPDLPVWLVLLALQQRGGIIDAHPSYIATVSGLPQADIELAISHFCEPDPASRTPDNDGRRLEPLEGRGFGWRVVNHDRYREKARKQAYDEKRTASGADAERKKASRAVPTSPAKSRALPLSEAEAEAYSEAESEKILRPPEAAHTPEFDAIREIFPKRSGSQPWPKAAKAINARRSEGHTWDALTAGAERYARFCEATGKVRTEYVMQASTFFGPDKRFLEPWTPPPTKAQSKQDANVLASHEWLERTQ